MGGGELTMAVPWLKGKDMTCTDHFLFRPVLSWRLVRVILSQENVHLLTACCGPGTVLHHSLPT